MKARGVYDVPSLRELHGFDEVESYYDQSSRREVLVARVGDRVEKTHRDAFTLLIIGNEIRSEVVESMAVELAERFRPLTVIFDHDPGDEDRSGEQF